MKQKHLLFTAAVLGAFVLFAVSGCSNPLMEKLLKTGGGNTSNINPGNLDITIPKNLVKSFSPIDDFAAFTVTVNGFTNNADAYGVELVISLPAGFTVTGHNAKGGEFLSCTKI